MPALKQKSYGSWMKLPHNPLIYKEFMRMAKPRASGGEKAGLLQRGRAISIRAPLKNA
jgi:hypothetical protein